MKKVLIIEAEVEKHLSAVLDAALKAGGLAALQSVNVIATSIQNQVEPTTNDDSK